MVGDTSNNVQRLLPQTISRIIQEMVGLGKKGHTMIFVLLHLPGETKAWMKKIACPPSLLATELSNSFSWGLIA